ncbi:hypothetical protein L1887_59113 [Cichorium endivia]|nr:hypothetical protein L1887_59113 [Cichorium endivia]
MAFQAEETHANAAVKPFRKQYRLFHAAFAQFCYTGAQFINYVKDADSSYSDATAAQLLAGAQGGFALGRFVGTFLMKFIRPRWVFLIYLGPVHRPSSHLRSACPATPALPCSSSRSSSKAFASPPSSPWACAVWASTPSADLVSLSAPCAVVRLCLLSWVQRLTLENDTKFGNDSAAVLLRGRVLVRDLRQFRAGLQEPGRCFHSDEGRNRECWARAKREVRMVRVACSVRRGWVTVRLGTPRLRTMGRCENQIQLRFIDHFIRSFRLRNFMSIIPRTAISP